MSCTPPGPHRRPLRTGRAQLGRNPVRRQRETIRTRSGDQRVQHQARLQIASAQPVGAGFNQPRFPEPIGNMPWTVLRPPMIGKSPIRLR